MNTGKASLTSQGKKRSIANEEDEDVSRPVEAGEPASFVFAGRRHYLVE